MIVNKAECLAAGIEERAVTRLASRIERLGRDCERLGVTIFMGSSNSIRFEDRSGRGQLILATMLGPFDGGAGDACLDADGLERGEGR